MNDLRVSRGLERQLEVRRELISSGQAPLGWKAGFGAPASLERFGLGGPLVGFMTDASLIVNGAEVDLTDWGRAVAEPELAVHLGQDLPAAGGETATRAAIYALGPAIELADIDPPPEEVEEILAGNIFHKGVVLGIPDPVRQGADLTGLEARVRLGDQELVRTNRLEDLTGRLVEVIAHLSDLLSDHGETMRAGEVVICGSVVPPIDLAPGTSVQFELYPMDPISITVR
ncbi:MAG: fumarylacetoacetate hydrolase family protein [Acidimicrobiia bacterium]